MDLDALKLILVPTDFSEVSAAALRVAVRLAQTFHAAIEVFHVDIDPRTWSASWPKYASPA